MIEVGKCIICGSKKLDKFNAECSPFLAERIFGTGVFDVTLFHCTNCDFAFYGPRLENTELDKLYDGYRGDDYQNQRQKFEPGYTKEINNSLGKSDIEINLRNSNMVKFLMGFNFDYSKIKSVLDYGGDEGQFIPREFGDIEKYVYEISGVPLRDGVKRISDLNCRKKFDFIMCCNVLEHVSDPHEIINNIGGFSHPGTLVYIELPMDSPLRTYIRRFAIAAFQRYPTLFRAYSKFSGSGKAVLKLVMHEHINHFGRKSVRRLFDLHGICTLYDKIDSATYYALAEVK